MKISDYAPRTGAIDAYLEGPNLIGLEIGVDAGAHAESLLTYTDIGRLYLIDIWDKEYYEGYCAGRLARWHHKIKMMKGSSVELMKTFQPMFFNFIYIDQAHDYESVKFDLENGWQKLASGGIMALRNYNGSNKDLKRAADAFKEDKRFIIENYHGEIIFFK